MRGYCEICDSLGINGGLSDDVVYSKHHLNNTVCTKHRHITWANIGVEE